MVLRDITIKGVASEILFLIPLKYHMFAKTPCLARRHVRRILDTSLSSTHIRTYMASLLELSVLPYLQGAWFLILPLFPAHTCPYMACFLELAVFSHSRKARFLKFL